MVYIFTLVTPPSLLSESIVKKIKNQYSSLHLEWLSQKEALDLTAPSYLTTKKEALSLYEDIRQYLNLNQADFFITSSYHRKKRLLVADMDSTIVHSETLDDLASEVGIGKQIAAITNRAMNGELVFADALKERIALLKDVPALLLEKTWQKIKLNEGAKTLVATMKKNQAYTALISGGFTFFTEKVSQLCGFDEHHANQLSLKNNKLDGTVIPPILGKEAKLSQLQRLIDRLNISVEESMTIGDGANDLPMLTYAGLGIGYYPKPIVAHQIINQIQHTSLLSALFIQGYQRSQFV